MRIFAAVFPPPSAFGHLERALAETQSLYPEGTFVKPKRAHFTLRFFGEFDVRSAEEIIGNACIGVPQFEVQVDRLGAFPNMERAKVLFLGSANPAPLVSLISSISAPRERESQPHLTLARFKEPRHIQANSVTPFSFRADSVKLINSVLGKGYEVLREWPLE